MNFYELCQSDGLVLRAHIYAGESTADGQNLGQTDAILMNIVCDGWVST